MIDGVQTKEGYSAVMEQLRKKLCINFQVNAQNWIHKTITLSCNISLQYRGSQEKSTQNARLVVVGMYKLTYPNIMCLHAVLILSAHSDIDSDE